MASESDRPFTVIEPDRPAGPIVFSSPHSGRAYSSAFQEMSRLDLATLRRSEDSFVDELFADAPGHGAPLLAATFPRSFVDVNRAADEWDPVLIHGHGAVPRGRVNDRVTAGLGVIPRIVATGVPIYDAPLSVAEVEARLARYYTPYHDALAALMDRAFRRWGRALLVDCHSMPQPSAELLSARLPRPPEIVLGNRYGTSCSPELMAFLERQFRSFGYMVVRNEPYAGGYCTQAYGRPESGIEAVQIEVSRPLYMDETRLEKTAGFDTVRDHLSQIVRRLILHWSNAAGTAFAAE